MSDPLTSDDAGDGVPQRPAPPDVGSAYMTEQGVLELSLRTEAADGTVGEALLIVPPDDARYADMVRHLGGIGPGEGRPIPPFPAKG